MRWAECNVAAFRTFAATAESYGMFYQWNRNMPWPVTGATGDAWDAANDPCPAGWRVPATEDFATLLDTDKVAYAWTTSNSVSGGRFTDKVSGVSIFLPAVGLRNYSNGTLSDADGVGNYWSSTQYSATNAWELFFRSPRCLPERLRPHVRPFSPLHPPIASGLIRAFA